MCCVHKKAAMIIILVIRPLKISVCRMVWTAEREREMDPSILRAAPMASVKFSQTH